MALLRNMTTTALSAALLATLMALTSCGDGGALGDNKQDKRTGQQKNCEPKDHAISTFLQVVSPDDPDCKKEKLPDIVVKPKEEHDGGPFTVTMNKALDIFHPIVSKYYGAELEMYNKIDDDAVNAVARKKGDIWQVEIFGGLQRAKGMSHDAVAMVLCHEMGHLIGGFPFVREAGNQSMSAEGNSDYFATQACLRKLWQDEDDRNAKAEEAEAKLPKKLVAACHKSFKTRDDIGMCMRSMAAIKSIQSLFNETSLTTPSTVKVKRTMVEHPPSQCRIDTFIAGALCNKTWDFERKFPTNRDELRLISCTRADYKGTIYDGVRPRCWYQPKKVRPNSDDKDKKKKKKKKMKRKKKKKTPQTKKPGKKKRKKTRTKTKPKTKKRTKTKKPTRTKTKKRTRQPASRR